jgi:hypothetical protein
VALSACNGPREQKAAPAPSVAPAKAREVEASEPVARAPAVARPSAGAELTIPAGTLSAGSAPGSPHRNPAREADGVAIELAGFAIDALPYPNDPAQPTLRLARRAEAAALCAAQGKRLCTELEWERACKGNEQREYPTGSFDPALCAQDRSACASAFGVFAMGTEGREWTASDATGPGGRKAVVRGAPKDAKAEQHRCAAREAVSPDGKDESLTFRCCRGPAPEVDYPEEPAYPPFAEQELTLEQVRARLAAMPETAALAAAFRPFRAEEVARRLSAQDHKRASLAPWIWTTKELVWSPGPGERIAVLAGDTPQGAILVAFHPTSAGGAHFATSYMTQGEHEPIVVAYKPDTPTQVLFSTCWGCGGEGGALEIGSDARVRIGLR